MTNIREIFAESWQKTAWPAEILGLNGPARPGPVHLNLLAGTARPGPICQPRDLQP